MISQFMLAMLIAKEQGDYRCVNCIEADRLTGMERALRKMADERMERLRASLALPDNGF